MKRFLTTSLLLTTTLITMAVFIIKTSLITEAGQVAGKTITINPPPVTVSFFIGAEGRFSIFGYTSAQALVSLDAIGSHDDTYAGSDGFFVFYNRPAPLFPQESCLTAQDQLGRLSNPICLPPFPNDYYVEIGPIILPPTLSLNNPPAGGNYYIGDEVLLTGQTIPNTDVNLEMFTDEKNSQRLLTDLHGVKKTVGGASEKVPREADFRSDRKSLAAEEVHERQNLPFFLRLIKPVEAFSFPELTTKSDDKGNFSIALPSSSSKTYRLFTQTNFQTQTSPKSITLELKILPVWMIIIKFFLFLWQIIKSRLLEIIILVEIAAVIAYLLKYYLQPHQLMISEHQMVKRENYDLMIREMEITKSIKS